MTTRANISAFESLLERPTFWDPSTYTGPKTEVPKKTTEEVVGDETLDLPSTADPDPNDPYYFDLRKKRRSNNDFLYF